MISKSPDTNLHTNDGPQAFLRTKEERLRGAYNPEAICKILSALHQDGLVLLQDVIDVNHVESINKSMCDEVEGIKADPTKGYNHGLKRMFSHAT